ncbi:MAG: hypothetical protein JSR83_00545 [Proteobacteria bacterium]|nr:hypothetical protein [Pseudomonadota bacterium]
MKRSKRIPLLVIGTAGLIAGCDGGGDVQELKQDFYAGREACERDWGRDPRNCQEDGGAGGGHGSGSGARGSSSTYAGPRYYWDRSAGHPVAVSPSGETRIVSDSYLSRGAPSTARGTVVSSVSRGGFGSSAHGFSAGG